MVILTTYIDRVKTGRGQRREGQEHAVPEANAQGGMRSAPENKGCDKSDKQKICVVNGYVVHWWQPWFDAGAQIGQATPSPLPAGRVNADLDGVAVAFAGPHFIEEPHIDNLCQFDACLPSRCMKTHISSGSGSEQAYERLLVLKYNTPMAHFVQKALVASEIFF